MARNSVCAFILFIATAVLLSGCSGGDIGNPWGATQRSGQFETAPTQTPTGATAPAMPGPALPAPGANAGQPAKIALLVPLTGKGSDAGQAMLNAAQLALFDLGNNSFELMPQDTQGTADGARQAAEMAIRDGAQMLLGPIFAADVRNVSPVAAASGKNVIAFSTDWTVATPNTFIMSFLPHSQVRRVVDYAVSKGITRLAIIAPDDAYGNVTAAAFDAQLRRRNLAPVTSLRFTGAGLRPDQLATLSPVNGQMPFDAVLIAADIARSAAISTQLTQAGLPGTQVRRLGTGLWDDPSVAGNPALQGAWYAASNPSGRAIFEQNYLRTYGTKPLRIASLAYDATALTAVMAKSGYGYDRQAILNPNGFSGIDGIFRFRPDGIVERGLSILEIRNNQAVVIEDQPRTFQNTGG